MDVGSLRRRVRPRHAHLTGVTGQQAREDQQQRGLPRPVRPDQRGDRSGRDVEIHVVDGDHVGERAADPASRDAAVRLDLLDSAVDVDHAAIQHRRAPGKPNLRCASLRSSGRVTVTGCGETPG
jgi:hypothetical protein